MKKKIIKKENKFNFLIIAIIPLLIFLIGFRLVVFDLDFYEKEFEKNEIYNHFSKDIVKLEVNNLFNYFINDKELTTNFFDQKEKTHLKDVKNLINSSIKLLFILIILFFLILIYYYKTKKINIFLNSLMLGSILTIFFIITLFLIVSSNFDSLFVNFHLILFDNNLWQLNPEIDNLIVLFPTQFFYDIVIRMIIISILISITTIISVFITKNKIRK
jgi:integral membrane protein (TIGR01906 family)